MWRRGGGADDIHPRRRGAAGSLHRRADTRYRPGYVVVPLARLADLTAHRRREVEVSRRYWGDAPGVFEDVEQGLRLRRSQTDRSLMLTEQGRVYSMSIRAVHDVREGREESCGISLLVTDARQLDDAHSRQTVLEVRV